MLKMFDELIYLNDFSNGTLCMLFRIEFVRKGFIENPTLLYVECGAKTFNENNKLLVRREEGGDG